MLHWKINNVWGIPNGMEMRLRFMQTFSGFNVNKAATTWMAEGKGGKLDSDYLGEHRELHTIPGLFTSSEAATKEL